jgi:hypothetical protein
MPLTRVCTPSAQLQSLQRSFYAQSCKDVHFFSEKEKEMCMRSVEFSKWNLVLECVSFRDFTCSQYFLKNIWKWQIISCWLNMPLLACEAFLGSILGLGLCVIGLLGLLVHWHGFDCRWAPWEELLSPEAEFAVESLAPGEEEPVVSRESFKKLNPKWQEEHRKKLLEEAKRKEKEWKPPTLEGSIWDLPLVFALIPPWDWPPPGWKVDAKELAFIREAHSLENVWVKSDDLKDAVEDESMEGAFPRWKCFWSSMMNGLQPIRST